MVGASGSSFINSCNQWKGFASNQSLMLSITEVMCSKAPNEDVRGEQCSFLVVDELLDRDLEKEDPELSEWKKSSPDQ